ncbi:hypothetical protein DCAR_0934917 [Daucus carota subsp. sativus]|uniref:Uncharacterized protein n=1 Tax=Daucus carota subsp. sativus TaxID=79200 RepID=A0A175YH54_DAUCS|nr:hypothetical protein DCAR_0934917 [Daucus carota subsp. sativus]
MYGQLTLLAPQMDGRQEMKAKMETVWNILVKIENCLQPASTIMLERQSTTLFFEDNDLQLPLDALMAGMQLE